MFLGLSRLACVARRIPDRQCWGLDWSGFCTAGTQAPPHSLQSWPHHLASSVISYPHACARAKPPAAASKPPAADHKSPGEPTGCTRGAAGRAGRTNTTRKDGWTWVLRLRQSPAKGKTKLTPRSCPTRASSAHSSPLKIFLNKELSASGKPQPSPTGSQMPGEKEAVSFRNDTLVVGEGTHAGYPGLPPAMMQALPLEASGRDRVRMLVLPVWSDFGSSLNSPSPPGGGINQRAACASLWETSV